MLANQQPNRNILLIYNNSDIREMLTQVLLFEGYDLKEVEDGLAAIGYLQSNSPPCLILLNIDELEAISEIEQFFRHSSIPIVAISEDLKSKHRAASLGADAYLTKPLDYDQLLNTICLLISSKEVKKAAVTA
jgi:CheY-like chemotaxis protein